MYSLKLAPVLVTLGVLALMPTSAGAATHCEISSKGSSYTVVLCIDSPLDGASLTGPETVTASVSVTGNDPGTRRMVFYLDGEYLLTDFAPPYTFVLPTDRFVDRARLLEAEALMRDGFTTDRTGIALQFDNGVTEPPVNNGTFTPTSGTTPPAGRPFVLAAVGDGAGGRPEADEVTDLIASWSPNMFLYLGDVYQNGTPTEFYNWYGTDGNIYGRFRSITNPIIGNHENLTLNSAGYFDYWDNVPNYYSFDAAGWHAVGIDSTGVFGETAPGSGQYQWIEQDLAANTAACTLAYFHHPAWSVGPSDPSGDTDRLRDIWALLASQGVDLVLTGHDHDYQRWYALDAVGSPDPNGTTEFVVGTGGHGIQGFVASDSRLAAGFDTSPEAFGALRVELNPEGAAYQFVDTQGTALDSGSVHCSATPPDTTPPAAPTDLIATSASALLVDLTWTSATDNVGVTGYEIYRDGVLLATTGAGTSYQDTSVNLDSTYQYQIRAFDAAGNLSGFSNVATVTTPSYLFHDGFESGDLSQWEGVFGLVVQQEETFAGTYAARGTSTGLKAYAYKQLSTTLSELYYRTWFKIVSQGSNNVYLLKFRTDTGSSILGLYVSSTGKLSYRNDVAGQSTGSSTVVTPGVWHEVQVRVFINGAAGETEVWLDSVRIDELSKAESLGSTAVGRIQLGENSSNRTFDVAADEVTLSTSFILSGPTPPTPTPTNTPLPPPTATNTPLPPPTATNTPLLPPTATNTPLPPPTATNTPLPPPTATNTPLTPPTPTNTPATGTFTFTPIADAYVGANKPDRNYGGSSRLRADASPERRGYLRFDVQGIGGSVVSATLRLYANSNHSVGYDARGVSDNGWGESTITYNNAPPVGSTVASSGAFSGGEWTEVDVTSLVTGNSTFSFAFTTASNTNMSLYSRETGTNAPQLVVETASGPPPTATDTPLPPPTATDTPLPPPTATDTPLPPPTATSTPLPPPTPTNTPASGSFTFTPVADAYVNANKPDRNYGGSSRLRADASPERRGYLRFDVQGIGGSVVSATLRMYANSNHSVGYDARGVPDNSWEESTITYDNAPPVGGIVASSGAFSGGEWTEVDVTSLVTGNGTFSFAFTTTSNTNMSLYSRETSNAPELVVEAG